MRASPEIIRPPVPVGSSKRAMPRPQFSQRNPTYQLPGAKDVFGCASNSPVKLSCGRILHLPFALKRSARVRVPERRRIAGAAFVSVRTFTRSRRCKGASAPELAEGDGTSRPRSARSEEMAASNSKKAEAVKLNRSAGATWARRSNSIFYSACRCWRLQAMSMRSDFLRFAGVFVSFMSGNSPQFSLAAASGGWRAAGRSACKPALFVERRAQNPSSAFQRGFST
jgi:hypothetical protein